MAAKKNNMGVKDKLMKKNLTQLKAQAKRLKLKGFSTKKKNDLVKSIMMAEARNKKSKTPMRGSKSVKRISKKRGARPNLPMRTPVQMRGRINRKMVNYMSGYNGWSNYETWLVNLHFDEYFQELADENPNMDAYELGQLYAQVVNDQVYNDDIREDYFLSDMINSFLAQVDYREIGESKDE